MIPLTTKGYEVYTDWVRIPPKTGACVQMGRPRFPEWEATFVMGVDGEEYADGTGETALAPMLKYAGKMIGVGAWRPQLKGPYGKFSVEKFEVK